MIYDKQHFPLWKWGENSIYWNTAKIIFGSVQTLGIWISISETSGVKILLISDQSLMDIG